MQALQGDEGLERGERPVLILRPDLIPPAFVSSAERVDLPEGRFYQSWLGTRLPSVTTVLGATKAERDRRGLARWVERVGAEEARAHTARRCEEGTEFHKEIEDLLSDPFADLGNPPPGSPFLESCRGFLAAIEEVVAVELPVISVWGYAGTLDLLARVKGRGLCVCDWKSTLYRKREEWIGDYLVQVSAYAKAVETQFMVEIDAGVVVLAEPGAPAMIRFVEAEELELGFSEFTLRLAEKKWKEARDG